jgi:hypothetical protein
MADQPADNGEVLSIIAGRCKSRVKFDAKKRSKDATIQA